VNVPILPAPMRKYECPNCTMRAVSREPGTPFHPCRGLAGLNAPLVPEGLRCKVVANEREDYINGDTVQYDGNNRPVMNVETVRDDGNDLVVYAPCATANLKL
jgi:hypothetical protein